MIAEIYPSLFLLRNALSASQSQFVYLLRHDAGVVLFGTKADLSAHYGDLRALGRITHVLLGDRHHASAYTAQLAQHFDVPIGASQIEASVLKGVTIRAIVPFRRTQILPALEAIPTPGHTPGALSYLWTREGRRFLFVGDTIVPVDGEWRYWVSKANQERHARVDATVGDARPRCNSVEFVCRDADGMDRGQPTRRGTTFRWSGPSLGVLTAGCQSVQAPLNDC
jgi:glyoxylase-like metal-dependent hydrolase (beta-lactamase superfamily II)